jgi:hypothetical protein
MGPESPSDGRLTWRLNLFILPPAASYICFTYVRSLPSPVGCAPLPLPLLAALPPLRVGPPHGLPPHHRVPNAYIYTYRLLILMALGENSMENAIPTVPCRRLYLSIYLSNTPETYFPSSTSVQHLLVTISPHILTYKSIILLVPTTAWFSWHCGPATLRWSRAPTFHYHL